MDQLEEFARNGKINEEAPVKDKQSMVISASIEEVWQLVTDINSWTQWNSQISSAEVKNDSEFTWKLNDASFSGKIAYQEKPFRFCWMSKGNLLKGVHVYKLDEVSENRTSVVLEGSMQGLKTVFSYNHRKMHRSFMKWLEDLSKQFSSDQ